MKNNLLTKIGLIICSLFMTSCNNNISWFKFYNNDRQEFNTNVFYGNVKTMQGADPSLIYVEEKENDSDSGYYYAYVTATSTINAWRTKDMTNWQFLGAVFRPNLDTHWGYLNFWAPAVHYDEKDQTYYMYYSATWKKYSSSHYVSLATSKSPMGPFNEYHNGNEPLINFKNIPSNHPLFEYHSPDSGIENGYFSAIDAEPFVDPVDNQKYLLFTHDKGAGYTSSSTYIMKMNDWWDADYNSVTCISQTGITSIGGKNEIDEGTVNEGPFMLYHDGLYYLTFSVNTYLESTYQVRQAVGKSPMGPFTKIDVDKGGTIITTDGLNIYTNSSGHHSFIKVGDELYISYHTFLNDSDIVEARKIRFDKISFIVNQDGVPVIYANGPTVTLQPLPSLISGYKNKAIEASINATNVDKNSNIYWLNDGTIKMHEESLVEETIFNKGKSVITLNWDEYITSKAIMVYNSYDFYTSFTQVDNIRIFYKHNNQEGYIDTGNLIFNYDIFSDQDYNCIFVGSSVAIEYQDMLIKQVQITISSSKNSDKIGIPEIAVLGK